MLRYRLFTTEDGGTLSKDERAAKMAVWLRQLQESATSGESPADCVRRHGWKLGEAYRWTQIQRRVRQWPAATKRPAADESRASTKQATPRFARVRIATEARPGSLAPLRVQLQLANGRRAELTLDDEAQLPRKS